MLDRQGGKMGVRHVACSQIGGAEKAIQDLAMPFSGLGNPGRPAIEPFLHLLPGLFKGLGTLKYAGIGYYPEETQQARPGKS